MNKWLIASAVAAATTALLFYRSRRQKQLGYMPHGWWRHPAPRREKLCYWTKTAAMNAFREANQPIIENYGGESYRVGLSEFDAINHKYGTKARTVAEAMWAAMPPGRPYCLDEIDLEALNDTSPAREARTNFRLPDYVNELIMQREEAAYYRDQPRYDDEVPF